MPRQHRHSTTRAEIAATAARALVDGFARDFDDARRRALRESRGGGKRALPDNLEIHQAIIEYLELFHAPQQRQRMLEMRGIALRALHLFEPFQARLCGPVWYGTATAATAISVHLFSDETEAVTRFLLERKIDYVLGHCTYRYGSSQGTRNMPQYSLELGGEAFEMGVFPQHGAWRQPLSAIDDRPLRRITAAQLEAVIEAQVLFPDDRPGQ